MLTDIAAGAQRNHEGGDLEEHHRAGRTGVDETTIDQDELEAEEQACNQSGSQGAVAFEHLHTAQPGNEHDHSQPADGAERRLGQRGISGSATFTEI